MSPFFKGRGLYTLRSFNNLAFRAIRRHDFSTKLNGSKPSTSHQTRARMERINASLPKFLRRYTEPLINAPLTHISAFLLLHELTAVVPLFALAGTFHYTQWLPSFIADGKWVAEGVEKFGRYFRKKGWLGEEGKGKYKWWGQGEGGTMVVVEFATAYAVTKALLPLRLILSVWATPWFARVAIIPGTNLFRRASSIGKKP